MRFILRSCNVMSKMLREPYEKNGDAVQPRRATEMNETIGIA